tara:strand:+ start:1371 stop:1637 length:267 start_codon:yes stop_codon:yes gene_type:complete
MSHTPKLVTKKKIKLEDKIDLTCILPKKYPTPLIIIKERYTKKLIKEIPIIKSDINKHTIGIERPIYLFLKLIIENNATAVMGVKLGG